MKILKSNTSHSQHLDRAQLSHFKVTKDEMFLPAESKSRRTVETSVKLRTVVRFHIISSNGAIATKCRQS
jgi:hypothetical protein